ncbi:efflux RND transporter periplasmic adaptor subunit [Nitrospirillum sp. BR 11828]|uniref:efflux RND transporter periplasmic adaptor subunit n=1 Tax=Nitrospirillum sp. BR 11828 TaxID=3104325 RepID=UPI002ACA058F|nr:efflux RND transporter periplasmic adaptor subunit [Nitrospirillum sp. BR 11828]MDZ5648338.1 efflux RND transporter periplasmic adaptor subunit [Nitrospirillum sp. BR 11828]
MGATLLLVAVVAMIVIRESDVAPAVAATAPQADPAPGTFQVTPGQWATLGMEAVTPHPFQTHIDTDGRVAANDEATTPVYSPVTGQVGTVVARVGDHVAKDAVLMTVEAADIAQGRSDLASAASAVAAADAQLRQARATEQRQHDLYQADGGALKDWQQSQADLVTAETAARTAHAALAAVRDRLRVLGRTPQEIAALANDGAALAPTPVRAPIAGTVLQRQVAPGQYVNGAASGGAVAFTIADLSSVWLLANVREADAPAVAVRQEVEARVPAYPARVFRGHVTAVAPALDPATRRLAVRVTLDNADGALKPEMMATVRLVSTPATPVLAVPERAVIHEGDEARVWVADASHHTLALRTVTLGRQQDGLVEVLNGLKAGDSVVTKGALFIDRAAQGD